MPPAQARQQILRPVHRHDQTRPGTHQKGDPRPVDAHTAGEARGRYGPQSQQQRGQAHHGAQREHPAPAPSLDDPSGGGGKHCLAHADHGGIQRHIAAATLRRVHLAQYADAVSQNNTVAEADDAPRRHELDHGTHEEAGTRASQTQGDAGGKHPFLPQNIAQPSGQRHGHCAQQVKQVP